jgi:hypothetical protein
MPGRLGPANGRESTADENVPVPAFGGDICSALEITAVGRALARLDDGDKLALRRSEAVGSTDTIWREAHRTAGARRISSASHQETGIKYEGI